ncbi:mis18-binding protein 1-like [Pecten maximus]|uniref:mis18-binding protein 1-like n=1 Tax=Pecten maximus TaxID=6579 RepID=UPI00145899A4|nr:mis18-binding protein 1-like [Pecten maximus]
MDDILDDVTEEDTIENGPDKKGKEKAAGKMANKEERILYEWIIKPVESVKGVCVEGKQSESANEEFWKSSVIRDRINKTTVQTASGTVYKLIGDIDHVYTLNEGFSKKLVNAFSYGFPKNWKQLIADYFDKTEIAIDSDEEHQQEKAEHKKPEVKKNKSKVKNLTTKNDHKFMSPKNTRGTQGEANSDTLVCTPVGQFVDLKNLKKTRSGRMVKPPLFWWMGQQIVTDSDKVELSAVTSHAKDHIQGIAHIYSGTKTKGKQTPNLNRSYNTKKIKLNKSMNKTVGNVLEMESSYRKAPSNKSLRSASKSSNSELEASCQNKKLNRRKGKKDSNNSTSLTDGDSNSQCSDSEYLDPVKDIEKTLQKSRSSRLKLQQKKGKCYDDSDSTSRKKESTVSDVFTISSDEEKTTRRGKQTSSKRQGKNTRKNTSRVKHSSTGEQSPSDLSSEENRKSEKYDKKKQADKMLREIQDSEKKDGRVTRSRVLDSSEKSDVRVTRSRVSDSSNLLSSLPSKNNNKVTRSRSRSQDAEPIRLRSQTKQTEASCRSPQEDHSDSDNEANKHSILSRKSSKSKRKSMFNYFGLFIFGGICSPN